jgi:large subunit ribosomal protein L35
MPKMKTSSAAKKRFTKTSTGRIKICKAFRRHLLTGKSAKRKRNMRRAGYLTGADQRNIAKVLPY